MTIAEGKTSSLLGAGSGSQFSLDIIGALEGTDKSSIVHDYLRHYENIFAPFKDEKINIIEIGVLGGASLRIWERFFSRAVIVGVDIDEAARAHAKERVVVEIGSQYDPDFLKHICAKYKPTIIIDDGSHLAHHVIFTFEKCFPFLVEGGFYIVEDMYFHLTAQAPQYSGPLGEHPPRYFQDMATRLMRRDLEPHEDHGFTQFAFNNVDEVRFFGGAVAIQKKSPRAMIDEMNQVEEFAVRNGGAAAWSGAAGYFLAKGDLGRAKTAAVRSLILEPNVANHHFQLGTIYDALGSPGDALSSYQKATELAPHNHWFWHRLGDNLARKGDQEGAEEAFRRAVATDPYNPIFQAALSSVGVSRSASSGAVLAP